MIAEIVGTRAEHLEDIRHHVTRCQERHVITAIPTTVKKLNVVEAGEGFSTMDRDSLKEIRLCDLCGVFLVTATVSPRLLKGFINFIFLFCHLTVSS